MVLFSCSWWDNWPHRAVPYQQPERDRKGVQPRLAAVGAPRGLLSVGAVSACCVITAFVLVCGRAFSRVPLSRRLEQPSSYVIQPDSGTIVLTWLYTFVAEDDVYFAFYYPFPYTDCQLLLDEIDQRLHRPPGCDVAIGYHPAPAGEASPVRKVPMPSPLAMPTVTNSPDRGPPLAASTPSATPTGLFLRASTIPRIVPPPTAAESNTASSPAPSTPQPSLYYHRELLIRSVEDRRVELLTVTSADGMLNEREALLPNLFPESDTCVRPRAFTGKAGVFVSARVVSRCPLARRPLCRPWHLCACVLFSHAAPR